MHYKPNAEARVNARQQARPHCVRGVQVAAQAAIHFLALGVTARVHKDPLHCSGILKLAMPVVSTSSRQAWHLDSSSSMPELAASSSFSSPNSNVGDSGRGRLNSECERTLSLGTPLRTLSRLATKLWMSCWRAMLAACGQAQLLHAYAQV